MDYSMTFDQLLADILQDYTNQSPDTDIAEGTLVHIKAACIASALWGIYKYQDYLAKSRFPDTCSDEDLRHYAAVYGITPTPGESSAELLADVLNRLQNPPAGGSKADYVAWAKSVCVATWAPWAASTTYAPGDVRKPSMSNAFLYICIVAGESAGTEPSWPTADGGTVVDGGVHWKKWNLDTYVENVKAVFVDPLSRGPGTFDIIVTSDSIAAGLEEEPSLQLLNAIYTYINGNDIRPLGDYDFGVQAPIKNEVAVAITVPDGTPQAVKDSITGDVQAYMRSLGIGVALWPSPLSAVCVKYGVPQSTLVTPSAVVNCWPTGNAGHYQRIWDLSITISEA
jgi:uncharacterized phage protein gp47/JayE